jgi:hypothetical protein
MRIRRQIGLKLAVLTVVAGVALFLIGSFRGRAARAEEASSR